MKTIKYLLLSCIMLLTFSCEISTDKAQELATEVSLSEANKQIGMPAIQNFQEKKIFKQILELRDSEDLITYCYLVNEMNGSIGQFLGMGIGYGVPASTQFTNPMKYEFDGKTLPQADPNGLFMPTTSDATYYLLLDSEGNVHPVYLEPNIIVSPIPLHDINEGI